MPVFLSVLSSAFRRLGPVAIASVVATSLLTIPPALAEDDEHENVELSGSHSDVQFLAGRSVRVTATVSDDVFAAGRNVTLDGADITNAIVAGYAVEQRSGRLNDLIAAGESVTVSGTISDDMIAFGRTIRIGTGAQIEGDARLAAETIEVDGDIGGSLKAAGRQITLNGTIEGKVDLAAERIIVGRGATIAGDLVYRGDNAPEITFGAIISGEVRRVESSLPNATQIGMAMIEIAITIVVGWAIAIIVLVTIVQMIFPNIAASATERLRDNPWSSLGIGMAGVLIAAALMIACFVSLLAIPLGLALMIAIGAVKLFGLTAASYLVGLLISRRSSDPDGIELGGRIVWTLTGTIILLVVFIIPFIGQLLASLAVVAGMGAAAREMWWRLRAV